MLGLVFRGYITGSAVPPWDFMGGGHVEAFRWYKDGGFFNPVSWFPYAWFGLPEHQLVQNGGWVLPIAVVAETIGWSPRNAALVQLFYIWIGGAGAFFLARALKWSLPISALVGFVYLFSIMNFSNAQHSAMVRAATLLPLLVVAVLPRWVLKSPFLLVITSFLTWQMIVSSYPGNLVAISISITGVILISVAALTPVLRVRYLTRVAAALLSGLLLSSVRWLPILLDRSSFPAVRENTAALTWELIPTFVTSFDISGLPNDVTMRSVWLAPICLAALFFVRRRNYVGLVSIGFGLLGLLAMSEAPGVRQVKDLIPGLRLSTFAISDWRPIVVLSAAVLLGSVLNDGLRRRPFARSAVAGRFALFATALGALAAIQYVRDGSLSGSVPLYLMALIAGAIFASVFIFSETKKPDWVIGAGLVLVTFASVLLISSSVDRTWQTDRSLSEAYVYGANFSDLREKALWPTTSRPARWYIEFPPLDYGEATGDARYNRYWVTGEPSSAGAHNVKFSKTYQKIIEAFDIGDTPLINFLSTESRQLIALPVSNSVSESDLNACAASALKCNPSSLSVDVVQLVFDRQGEEFQINAMSPFQLIQNEPAHFGWQSQICEGPSASLSCKTGPDSVLSSDALRAWYLPAGQYVLQTQFVTPGDDVRWWLFGLGALLGLGYPLVASYRVLSNRIYSR